MISFIEYSNVFFKKKKNDDFCFQNLEKINKKKKLKRMFINSFNWFKNIIYY